MDFRKLTAPCGRDCFNCPFYLAKNDQRIRKTMAERMKISEEKIECNSCRELKGNCEVLKNYGFSGTCKIYLCVSIREHEFCFECSEFPCRLLRPLADGAERFPHNLKVYNLCRIKNAGLEKWAREEAKPDFENYYKGKLSDCLG
jgi:hypothetical protein